MMPFPWLCSGLIWGLLICYHAQSACPHNGPYLQAARRDGCFPAVFPLLSLCHPVHLSQQSLHVEVKSPLWCLTCFFTVTRENLMLFFGSYVSVIAKSSTKNNSLQFCLLWFLLLFEVLMVWMRQALCKQTLQDAFKDSQSWDRICLRVLSVFLPLMPHWMCLLQHIYR